MPTRKLKVEEAPLATLYPAPWNPRDITEFQARALRASLETYGAVEPLVINADGMILGGHQRAAAAADLGWTSFPAVRLDLEEREAKLLNLALNKIAGVWNERELANVISSVTSTPVELLVAGFGEHEVAAILAGLGEVEAPGEFPSPNTETDHECPSCSYQWSGPCR